MIAHVAEVAEERGRVVLQLSSSGVCSDIALEAAVAVARAFNSGIESLFVEDEAILNMAGYPFACEISHSGRVTAGIEPAAMERDLRSVASVLQRRIMAFAQRAEVPLQCRTVRDDPVHALAVACMEHGPWNIVALSEPWSPGRIGALDRLFAEVQGTTAVVVAGPAAKRVKGPVVALIEDYDRISGMIRAARRIAEVSGAEVKLLVAGTDGEHLDWIEGQVRLALGEQANSLVMVASAGRGDPAAIAETLRRWGAGFVIAQAGGIISAAAVGGRPLAAVLEGPVLLVR